MNSSRITIYELYVVPSGIDDVDYWPKNTVRVWYDVKRRYRYFAVDHNDVDEFGPTNVTCVHWAIRVATIRCPVNLSITQYLVNNGRLLDKYVVGSVDVVFDSTRGTPPLPTENDMQSCTRNRIVELTAEIVMDMLLDYAAYRKCIVKTQIGKMAYCR